LVAEKSWQKTGDVTINKRVETEQAQISVPIEKERVVISHTTPTDADIPVAPDTADFRNEVIRMSLYEETPDIHKETFVHEEVNVRKEVERNTVEAQEQLRREELDMNTEIRPDVDNNYNQRKSDRR
jgi:uncharacterized protein (TIGR02271 family)